MIVVLGPTAAGKSTLARSLCRRLGRCVFTVAEPFGGLAYLLLLVVTSLLRRVYGPAPLLFSRKRLAQLEIANPGLLGKLLPLLVLLDMVSALLRHIVLRIVEKTGMACVVEDGAPQALVDHMVYCGLYSRGSRAVKALIRVEASALYKLLGSRDACVIVYTRPRERVERARKRGDKSVAGSAGFYNDVVRYRLPLVLCRLIGRRVAVIHH